MRDQTKIQLAVELHQIFGEHLCMLRMGAMFCQARPELARLLIEATTPDTPTDAPVELQESALRVVASGDAMLQSVIDVLAGAQETIDKEGD